MNLNIIKKLLLSSVVEDLDLAMILLAKYLQENGVESLNSNFYGVEGALELPDFPHSEVGDWSLVIIRDKFAINLTGSLIKNRRVVYRQGGSAFYKECLRYTDKIIYEE